jgi:hypothetical protein
MSFTGSSKAKPPIAQKGFKGIRQSLLFSYFFRLQQGIDYFFGTGAIASPVSLMHSSF